VNVIFFIGRKEKKVGIGAERCELETKCREKNIKSAVKEKASREKKNAVKEKASVPALRARDGRVGGKTRARADERAGNGCRRRVTTVRASDADTPHGTRLLLLVH
jgi:hypothetical protein